MKDNNIIIPDPIKFHYDINVIYPEIVLSEDYDKIIESYSKPKIENKTIENKSNFNKIYDSKALERKIKEIGSFTGKSYPQPEYLYIHHVSKEIPKKNKELKRILPGEISVISEETESEEKEYKGRLYIPIPKNENKKKEEPKIKNNLNYDKFMKEQWNLRIKK